MVVGKTARIKQWVSGQQLDSFSDLEAGSDDGSDDASTDAEGSVNGQKENGIENGEGHSTSHLDPIRNWESFEELARKSIGTSKTSQRTHFLNDILAKQLRQNVLTPQQLSIILKILIPTYPRYIDQPSRNAVLSCLLLVLEADLTKQDGKLTEVTVRWLDNEINTKVCGSTHFASGATILNILCWTVTIFAAHAKFIGADKLDQHASWPSLVKSLAACFDALQLSNVKTSVKKGGAVVVRRFIRNNPTIIPLLLKHLSNAQFKPPTMAAALLGETIGTALRLKPKAGLEEGQGRAWVQEDKSTILGFYREQVLAARTALPPHVATAFNDFIGEYISSEDLKSDSELVKTMEKSLLRNPELALPTIDAFFTAYTSPVSLDNQLKEQRSPPAELVKQKLLPPILTASKSSNALVRSSAALLFNTLVSPFNGERNEAPEFLASLAKEAGALLKANKTASPEHRIAICQLLLSLTSFPIYKPEVLIEICEAICGSLAKETNDAAMRASLQTMTIAMEPLVENNSDKLKTANAAMVKGIQDSKLNVRRQYLGAVGELLWRLSSSTVDVSSSSKDFAKAILPGLESALKNASGTTAGLAVEGWIAVAVLRGAISDWGVAEATVSKNQIMQSLLVSTPKPSFLLAEKGYRKLSNSDDEVWLVRALESVMSAPQDMAKIADDAGLRIAATQPLIHVAMESQVHENRKASLQAIARITLSHPDGLATPVFTAGLEHWLVQAEHNDEMKASTEEVIMPYRPARLRRVLAAIAKIGKAHEESFCDLLVISHHALLAPRKGSLWIELVLGASRDPQAVASTHTSTLLQKIWQYSTHRSKLSCDAAYRSIATLAFVAPDALLPPLVKHTSTALQASALGFVGSTELGIFNTPEGQTYVDVLAASAKGAASTSKGKTAAIDKWDEETRLALAAKKKAGANAVLSKADKALVDAQLAKEAEIRQRISQALVRVHQGLRTIQSLLTAKTEAVLEYIPTLSSSLLEAVRTPNAALYAEEAFQTFLRLYEECASRVGEVRLSMALAVLRGEESIIVPADFKAEGLSSLVTRVLYRLRFQSDSKPFDAGTFALSAPLLGKCIDKEGLGIQAGDNDAAMEQLALVIDVIGFHVRQFADKAFPRLQMINSLISALMKFPSLAKPCTDALVQLGQAIEGNAEKDEIAALLHGLLVDEAQVRHACLQALAPLDLTEMDYSDELWIVTQDSDERNATAALSIWEDNGLDVRESSITSLLPFLDHPSTFVRASAALALSEAVSHLPQLAKDAIDLLASDYREAARERLPEYDRFGMLVEASLHQVDPWQHRVAIAETLEHMAELYGSEEVVALFNLLIQEQALGDRSEIVQSKMLNAGIAAVDLQGKQNLQSLMDLYQGYLGGRQGSKATDDRITESVIVLLGRLARHLEPSDPRVVSVTDRLLLALRTPSELVQVAVADCLPPLIKANREKAATVIEQLLRETLQSTRYAERRGAAYGLAGAVKGRGLTSLKEFDVISRLTDATEDKKNANARQGAVFGFETLSSTLGRLFEPYVSKIIPILLTCLGDTSLEVREATSDAARVIMSKISGHAVKVILPSLLSALDDRQWRTKKGAIELMGTMAYLAPKQLSQSLPAILPPLTDVLTDTHTQVRAAANASLKKFGEVVSNPEIQAMQSTLLGALVDPTKKTGKALDILLTTSFVHYIDTSSLALIVPIIDRGLRERGTELKRKGAQIVGNLASLTDSKDLISYLPQLIPRVREVLIDPVPEARSTAAKSLGVLIERLGEDAFPTLVQDLMDTLKSDASGVDQQGAAQGLSEVLSGLGVERMEHMLPEIIQNTSSSRAYVREGFISLLVFLPSVFGERFSPYLGRIIQPVLGGLADDSEYVREASMRAGRMIVANHSGKAIDLLLPELERGLFDQSWRIRLSSIQLVGELLFRISGISGKTDLEDEEAKEEEDTYHSNAEAAKKMLDVLGRERRDRVLSALYILRQDSAGQVRTFSIGVWKALVSNTPRTVRDMLPSLMQIIIRLLASPGEEQQENTARTLGELCRKQGDRILGDIIPILQQASQGSVTSRQGCCLAFAEMLESTTKAQLEGHEDAIIESVRGALVDESPIVRQAAAQAFDALQTQIGARSIDQTIPTLLGALTGEGGASEAALSALKELMAVRSQAIFPILIPTLLASPISSFNARSLASLVTVAGSALNRRLAQILDALQKNKDEQEDEEIKADLTAAIEAVLASVTDTEGLHMLMLHLLGLAKDPRAHKRVGGCELFTSFCQVTEEDFSNYHVDWIRQLLSLYEEQSDEVLEASRKGFEGLGRTLSKDQMEALSVPLRRTIEMTAAPGHEVPGFCRAGGLKPILPILIQGLLAGTNEQREQSALGLGDVVERTAVDALKPYVTQITGPLIRIIAERYPAPVKAAILSTLTVLLVRVPQFVRPFFPQLQRTFVKNLSELSSITIRSRAAQGLGVLMGLQPRIDPLITELVNGCSHEEQEVRDAMSNALAAVVLSGGNNTGPASREQIADLVRNTLEEPGKEAFNNGIAKTLAAMLSHNMSQADSLAIQLWEGKATPLSSIALVHCLETAPEQLYKLNVIKVVSRILKNVINEHTGVARPAREARELLKKTEPWSEDSEVQSRVA